MTKITTGKAPLYFFWLGAEADISLWEYEEGPGISEINEDAVQELASSLTEELTCQHTRRELRNYSLYWNDGDVHCKDCGEVLRSYDAG